MVRKTLNYRGPSTHGRTVRAGLQGSSSEEIIAYAKRLNPVHYPQQLTVSYVINGETRLLQSAQAFDELPDGSTVTVEVFDDPDHEHYELARKRLLADAERVVKGGCVPICQLLGVIGCGKSSFVNTLLGAIMQGGDAPLFAQPGNGIEHQTQELEDVRYHARVFAHTNSEAGMPTVSAPPVIIRDTRGLNVNVTANEKKMLTLALNGGIGVGQTMVWDKISCLHVARHYFFRGGRAPDVACILWPATLDPGVAGNGDLLTAIKQAVASLDVRIPVFLIITKDDKLLDSYADKVAANVELQRRKRKAAAMLGASSDHTFTVTNVCADSRAGHTAYVDSQFITIFSRIMHAGERTRRRRRGK